MSGARHILKSQAHQLAKWVDTAALRRFMFQHDLPAWNFGSRRTEFEQADIIVASIPKCGRTWVRVFLSTFIDGIEDDAQTLPRIMYTHDRWEHITTASTRKWLLGTHLIPPAQRAATPTILLVRDPRDIIVSLYFQLSRRDGRFSGTLEEMLRHPLFGVDPIVIAMNNWVAEWADRDDFMIACYEHLRREPVAGMSEVVRFVGFDPVRHADALRAAVEATSFEALQKKEHKGQFKESYLRPGDVADPESFKVRRGKVGGYRDYLGPADVDYLNARLAPLDPRFGYHEEP